jgi:hypothetical protein
MMVENDNITEYEGRILSWIYLGTDIQIIIKLIRFEMSCHFYV